MSAWTYKSHSVSLASVEANRQYSIFWFNFDFDLVITSMWEIRNMTLNYLPLNIEQVADNSFKLHDRASLVFSIATFH